VAAACVLFVRKRRAGRVVIHEVLEEIRCRRASLPSSFFLCTHIFNLRRIKVSVSSSSAPRLYIYSIVIAATAIVPLV
jgi:hypothetical protein